MNAGASRFATSSVAVAEPNPSNAGEVGRGAAQWDDETRGYAESILNQPPRLEQVPFRPTVAKIGPRADKLLKSIVWAADMPPTLESEYLVKGWLYRGQTSVLYGAANVGKSFLGLDLAHAISKGRSWNGRRVRKGRVLYIATEGGRGISNRVAALDDPEFHILTSSLLLTGSSSQAQFLAEAVAHISPDGQLDFIVIDTMARVMGQADENAAPDIADLLHNVGIIHGATGAHVMIIHHSGKDTDRGARGHSALRAAVDTEIELKRNDKTSFITAWMTKQRDGTTGHRFDFELRQIELGLDQDGDPITTCVVEPKDRTLKALSEMSDPQRQALGILELLLAKENEVSLDRWRTACILDGGMSQSECQTSHAKAFQRATEKLISLGLVHVQNGKVLVVLR